MSCKRNVLFESNIYRIVTSASGVFNGSPLRNARDITIFEEFASLIVPWKIPKSSTHLIETAFPIQFSLMFSPFQFRPINFYFTITKFK